MEPNGSSLVDGAAAGAPPNMELLDEEPPKDDVAAGAGAGG